MRKVVTFMTLMAFVCCLSAQDVIQKRNGERIEAKVTAISETSITYVKWSNQTGPTYTISKGDVQQIRYENGDVDEFQAVKPSSSASTHVTEESMSRGNVDLLQRQSLMRKSYLNMGVGVLCIPAAIGVKVYYNNRYSSGFLERQSRTIGTVAAVAIGLAGVGFFVKGVRQQDSAFTPKGSVAMIHLGSTTIEPSLGFLSCESSNRDVMSFGATISF